MQAWDTGPFENEVAEAFGTELDSDDPGQRDVLIRSALQAAVDSDGSLDTEVAFRAVAAAAVVAARRPGAPRLDSDFAPEFLALDEVPPPPADLAPLALEALDRVEEEDSGWSQLWIKQEALAEAVNELEFLRDALG
jgi:hypothetical protein